MEISKVEIIDGECYVGMNMLENEVAKNVILTKENTNLKQALNEIREYINKLEIKTIDYGVTTNWEELRATKSDFKNDILQIIDKVGGNEK